MFLHEEKLEWTWAIQIHLQKQTNLCITSQWLIIEFNHFISLTLIYFFSEGWVFKTWENMMLHLLALEDLHISHILSHILVTSFRCKTTSFSFISWLSKTLFKRLLEQHWNLFKRWQTLCLHRVKGHLTTALPCLSWQLSGFYPGPLISFYSMRRMGVIRMT